MTYQLPKFKFNVPFFMMDIDNYQLITTPTIPGDISDSKDIILTEMPVPGLNYQPVQPGGGGNRKISFTLPLIKRNNNIGNLVILKQFDMLRNQVQGFSQMFSSQFKPNPKVLFYYGVGSVPLIYYVKKCDATHKEGWVNEMGNPQYSEISIELWLHEAHQLYQGEEVFRRITSVAGMVEGLYQTATSRLRNPY